jgi:hypothetical protein
MRRDSHIPSGLCSLSARPRLIAGFRAFPVAICSAFLFAVLATSGKLRRTRRTAGGGRPARRSPGRGRLRESHERRDSRAHTFDRLRPGRDLFQVNLPRSLCSLLRLFGREDDQAYASEPPAHASNRSRHRRDSRSAATVEWDVEAGIGPGGATPVLRYRFRYQVDPCRPSGLTDWPPLQPFLSSPGWTRTNNPPVNSRMLCQLSYWGKRASV